MDYFLGTFENKLDDHNRLSIPARFRKVMAQLDEDNFIISREQEHYLTVYPYKFWKTQIGDKVAALPHRDPRANRLRRLLGIKTTEVSLDKQGRINIPAEYYEHAGIDKHVKIIGTVDTIQLWNPEAFDKISQTTEEQSVTEDYEAYGI